jgi:D-proline reductase (dithiol) PrdB
MAELSELPLWMQAFMKAYPYRKSQWTTAATAPPLARARVALVTTAGLHAKDQPTFDASIKSGDCSYRVIPGDIDVQELVVAHKSNAFDHSGIEQDKNLCFPLDTFRELAAEKVIGELNARHLSFMGSITAPGRLIKETAPEAAALLKSDRVDIAFLTPV